MASFTERQFSALPGSSTSLHLISRNNIDKEGVERNEAGVYILSVCLVRIKGVHIHYHNVYSYTCTKSFRAESVGKTRHPDPCYRRECRNLFTERLEVLNHRSKSSLNYSGKIKVDLICIAP